jgi:hypothetical protein
VADFTSDRFPREPLLGRYKRADLELHGVDHTSPSYEGRVFLNNPDADETTERTEENGYLGAFHVFGKAGCWGEEGHCDEPVGRRRYDRRRNPTRYAKVRLTLPDNLRELVSQREGELTLSIVAAVPERQPREAEAQALRFKRLSIITYG